MASIVSAGTTSATALNMSADTTGILQLASNNGTVALTVGTTQNVGIGTTGPARKLVVSNAGAQGFEFGAGVGSGSGNELLNYNRTTSLYVPCQTYASEHAFYSSTSGGNLALNITTAGVVTTPSQPSFEAYNATDNTYNGTAQNTPMVYNATYRNAGSHYNTANGTFTAPVAGYYTFFAGAYASNTAITQIWAIQNGARTVSISIKPTGGTPGDTISGSATVYLAANDTFGVFAYSQSGSNPQTLYSNPYHTFFKGFFLG
jgi:hypothetical protein